MAYTDTDIIRMRHSYAQATILALFAILPCLSNTLPLKYSASQLLCLSITLPLNYSVLIVREMR